MIVKVPSFVISQTNIHVWTFTLYHTKLTDSFSMTTFLITFMNVRLCWLEAGKVFHEGTFLICKCWSVGPNQPLKMVFPKTLFYCTIEIFTLTLYFVLLYISIKHFSLCRNEGWGTPNFLYDTGTRTMLFLYPYL